MARRKALAFALFILLILAAGWYLPQQHPQLFSQGAVELRALIDKNFALAALIYFVCASIGAAIFALPGVAFALFAGAAFGPVWGSLLCWAAVSCGANLAFLLGRYFLRDAVAPMLERSPLLKRALLGRSTTGDIFVLALTRLVPVFPYNVQNYAYGVTNISFGRYALFSTLFLLPGTCIYTLGAAGLANEQVRVVSLVVAAVLLVCTLLVSQLLRRYVQQREQRSRAHNGKDLV